MTAGDPSRFTAARVRKDFLDFFEARGHRIVPSAPVFPQDDPTLLFTNAGMNQFKDVFLGTGQRDYRRAADTQKCIRVQGKHNDLEEVGRDTYHHTFFEMLGNWSFGDYFKEEAITWSWELLTKVWGLPKERLWVTVFEGDAEDGLPADDEAARIWAEKTDIDPTHILLFGKKDNFWEMGDTGPCGPCTEIHIDRGEAGADPRDGADRAIGVNAGNERFIELWNNVFIQFNRQDDGRLVELPAKHVDTGMGFERVLSVLQGKRSNYDTDLFQPIFRALEGLSGATYSGGDSEADVTFRVSADHVRAVSSAIADGVTPSNEGRGYVLRRLLRRASRYGKQNLGLEEPFLWRLVPAVAEVLRGAFPEIGERVEHVQLVIRAEEEAFRKTLDRGLVQFEKLAKGRAAGDVLDGGAAYDLYATFGFPEDLVELMARERGMSVDRGGFEAARAKHSEASRGEGSFKQLLSAEQLTGLSRTAAEYHADHGGRTECAAQVVRYLSEAGRPDRLVLDRTSFYAESGGQVGDTGVIEAADGSFQFTVAETHKLGDVHVHVGELRGSAPAVGAAVRCVADRARRDAIRANHTATHLLHQALRDTLGEHVAQQGSYVGPDRLRFDVSHPKGMTHDELAAVEDAVNARVARDSEVVTTIDSPERAKARGAMALFGEKYGDEVRVVSIDGAPGERPWSLELCGGTHVARTGEIGPFIVVSERAVAAGVRRIEAVTQREAVRAFQEQRAVLQALSNQLKTKPADLAERITQLQTQLKEAKKAQKAAAGADISVVFEKAKETLTERAGVSAGALDLGEVDQDTLREVGDRLKGFAPNLAVVLFGRADGKVPYVALCQGAALAKGLKAGDLAQVVKTHLGGGGGGRPDSAQGRGDNPAAVVSAIEALRERFTAGLRV
ncbi:MAG: alanine--tRNA ligase [Planctomycetota bacterium]